MKKKRFVVYVTEDEQEEIFRIAKEREIPVSRLVHNLVVENLSIRGEVQGEEIAEGENDLRIRLSTREKIILEKRAAETRLTNGDYVRYLIRQQKPVIIDTNGLEDYTATVYEAVKAIRGIVTLIRKSGGKILQSDVNRLIQIADELNKTCKQQLKNSYYEARKERQRLKEEKAKED